MTTYEIDVDANVGESPAAVCAIKAAEGEPPYTDFRLHHIPNWLRLRILRRIQGRAYCSTAAWAVYQSALHKFCGGWADHVGSAKYDGKLIFVSQPYGLYDMSAQQLFSFCRGVGVNCRVDPRSQWAAGGTLSILVLPPEGHGR